MLEGLSLSVVALVINILGLPGLIFVVWYVDQKRLDKVLSKYNEDMSRVIRMYEDNVILVKNYSRLAEDLAGIIQMNTQAQTNLVNAINHNHFCPKVREETGKQ